MVYYELGNYNKIILEIVKQKLIPINLEQNEKSIFDRDKN